MVEQDGDPRHEHAGRREAEEPVEGSQCAAGQGHEAEEHEDGEERDAGVGDTPRGGPEEDGGGLLLEGKGVECARSGEQGLVGRGPGRGDEYGVDHGGDGGQIGGLGGNDKGALGNVRAVRVEPRVVGGDEHADD